jgi:hypothetical protein
MATLTTAAASALAQALNTYINSGGPAKIIIKDGTPPANANAAATGTTLATFTLSNPAFTESNGVLTLADPPKTVAASASGTATYFRIMLNNGTTTVLQGTVGTGSGELSLNTTTITASVNVSITSGTITVPTA